MQTGFDLINLGIYFKYSSIFLVLLQMSEDMEKIICGEGRKQDRTYITYDAVSYTSDLMDKGNAIGEQKIT